MQSAVNPACAMAFHGPGVSECAGSTCTMDITASSASSGSQSQGAPKSSSSFNPSPFDLPLDESALDSAARSLQMAWALLFQAVPKSTIRNSLLVSGRRMSSSCTGAYTAEMALSIVCKMVSDSNLLGEPVRIRSVRCHDFWLQVCHVCSPHRNFHRLQ